MNNDDIIVKSYLEALCRESNGDTGATLSMHDIGVPLGLDKGESGRMAEGLMVEGLIDLKTLAGGIGITEDGLAFLGISPAPKEQPDAPGSLSEGPLVNDMDLSIITGLMEQIKKELTASQLDYALLEEAVIDLKTLDTQLLSPRPKMAVVMELFRSIHGGLASSETSSPLITALGGILK